MGRPPRITRDQILEASRAAFGTRGFAATTLADIAARLDVTPAAILRHFESKETLFHAAMSSRAIAVPDFVTDLPKLDAGADPRVVLRAFAGQLVAFLSDILRPAIAVQMHATTLVVPFDPRQEEIPPKRALTLLAGYFARAMKAGTIREADPHALALLFLGQLQAYVFFHQILNVQPAFPLDRYIDALIDLWADGVIRGGSSAQEDHRAARRPRPRGGGTPVREETKRAETTRPRRNARGKDGERGVARRRPRQPRPRR